jgi:hypothetical protein
MPPHCDSMDGPVVRAAARALDSGDAVLILPYVTADAEDPLRDAFDLALKARAGGGEAAQVADLYFYETAVRLHRAGEGAPYTGLKPAGLDVGPVIPIAERAIETSDPSELAAFLADAVRAETLERFAAMQRAKDAAATDGVVAARASVQAALGLQVWAHKLFGAVHAAAHEGAHPEHL